MDLAFLLSARGLDSEKNFIKMKSIINEILNSQGSEVVRYSVMTFGKEPKVVLDFGVLSETKDLREFFRGIPKNMDGADLHKALKVAGDLFRKAATARPYAKQVLVVVMDKTSDSDVDEVELASKSLAEDGVRVIAVAFGKESDLQEISQTTSNDNNIVKTDETDLAKNIAEEVMKKAKNGKM